LKALYPQNYPHNSRLRLWLPQRFFG